MTSMSHAPDDQPDQAPPSLADIPDRTCTWCKIPMMKRLVGGDQFIHYTWKRGAKKA